MEIDSNLFKWALLNAERKEILEDLQYYKVNKNKEKINPLNKRLTQINSKVLELEDKISTKYFNVENETIN